MTNFVAHDGCIVQRLADGNIAVIGHGSQEEKLCGPQEYVKEQLTCTTIVRNCLFLGYNGD